MTKQKPKKKDKVKFEITGLKEQEGTYKLIFMASYKEGIPHVIICNGQKRQIGYAIEQPEEMHLWDGRFDKYKLKVAKIALRERPAFLVSGNTYQMQLNPRDDHEFYLMQLARIILTSKGKPKIRLPISYERVLRPRLKSESADGRYEVAYANQTLEKRLSEI